MPSAPSTNNFIQLSPSHKPHLHYDLILRCSLLAFGDALRTQSTALSAVRYVIGLSFSLLDFKPLLPPRDTVGLIYIPQCRFNLEIKKHENLPTASFIVELGEVPISNTWEAKRIITVH
jgi:hypothetical protein